MLTVETFISHEQTCRHAKRILARMTRDEVMVTTCNMNNRSVHSVSINLYKSKWKVIMVKNFEKQNHLQMKRHIATSVRPIGGIRNDRIEWCAKFVSDQFGNERRQTVSRSDPVRSG